MDDTPLAGYPDAGPDTAADSSADSGPDGRSEFRDRFERAIRGIHRPKARQSALPLKTLTIDERQRRLLAVSECVRLGMAVEQMVDYLPTLGIPASRSTVYDYLAGLKLPRGYRRAEGGQSHHDYFTFRFFLRIAQDAFRAGYTTRKLLKGRLAWEGLRFRPDFSFEVGRYRFFMELQLSDLTETLWWVKFRNYLRLRRATGMKFRALFVIDQQGDLDYARRFARHLLEREGAANLYLFIGLSELKGSGNVAIDPCWRTPWGERESLLQWLPLPGQNPAMQR